MVHTIFCARASMGPCYATRYDANMPPKRALQMPLSTVAKEIKPIAVRALPGGEYLYTFPVNFVGTISGPLPHAASGSSLNIWASGWKQPGLLKWNRGPHQSVGHVFVACAQICRIPLLRVTNNR